MPSVGEVHYDVLPNLDRFASEVAAKLGQQKPIKIPVEVDTKSAQSLKQTAASTTKLTQESNRLAAAQGRVRVAAAALNETRGKAQAGSSRLIAAEERYANAIRGVQNVQASEAKATARAQAAREAASAKAAAATERATAREAASQQKAAAAAEKATTQQVAARRRATQDLGTGLTVAGAAATAALVGVTRVTADFDEAVSHVASTGADARANIGALRAEAIKYGADTAFSAREAANAQEELIKANVSVTDTINGGLKGALDLAAAGTLGVADAAGIMGTAMSNFNLPGTDASHVADLLAAAAGKAQGEVSDFAEAMKYVGPLAQSAGVSIEETTGVLAEFANQGILGSQAGTSLRGILLGLTAPSAAAAKTMAAYGINVRDASGQFIGMAGAATELQDKLGGLGKAERDAALARIFGRNSITAATVLYEQGAAGVKSWTDAVNDSGYASQVAQTKMDNLKGDVEQLKGAFDSAFINSGGGGTKFLRSLAQDATSAIDKFNALPESLQQGAFKFAAFAAASLLATGGMIKLVGAAASARTSLQVLGVTASGTRAKLAGLNKGGLLAAAGFVAAQAASQALSDQVDRNSAGIDGYSKSLKSLNQGQLDKQFDQFGSSFALLGQGVDDTASAFRALADTQNPVSQGFRKVGDALGMASTAGLLADEFDKIDQALVNMDPTAAAKAFSKLSAEARAAGLSTEQINSTFDDYVKKQREAAEAARDAATGANLVGSLKAQQDGAIAAGDALADMGKKARPTADDVKALSSALWDSSNAALAAVDAEVAYEAALDQTAATAKKNKGKGVSTKSETGRENVQALESQARASQALIDSYIKQGKSVKTVGDKTAEARKAFIKNAETMGVGEKAAGKLADKYGLIPKKVETKVEAQISAKKAADVAKLQESIKSFPPSVKSEINTLVKSGNIDAAKKKVKEYKTSIDAIPKTKNIDAKVKSTGVSQTQKSIKGIKGTNVDAKVKPTGVSDTQKKIHSIKGGSAVVRVTQEGAGDVQSKINAIHGTSVSVRVRQVSATADGGTWGKPAFAGGGTIAGRGGPREDNIAIMDRSSGRQMAWGSVGEEVTNAVSAEANRGILKMINAGGRRQWDLIPRRADGGTLTRPGGGAGRVSGGARTINLMLDMGPLFGGVQTLVLDLMDGRDEYAATVGRMG